MRITQEADYAIRICIVLDERGEKTGASEIADLACITPNITLKVLKKLVAQGIVQSFKGAKGGYQLLRDGEELKVLEIIEAIDGAVYISKCLEGEHKCTKNPRKSCCKMHIAFGAINKSLKDNLGKISIAMLNDERLGFSDIADIIN